MGAAVGEAERGGRMGEHRPQRFCVAIGVVVDVGHEQGGRIGRHHLEHQRGGVHAPGFGPTGDRLLEAGFVVDGIAERKHAVPSGAEKGPVGIAVLLLLGDDRRSEGGVGQSRDLFGDGQTRQGGKARPVIERVIRRA